VPLGIGKTIQPAISLLTSASVRWCMAMVDSARKNCRLKADDMQKPIDSPRPIVVIRTNYDLGFHVS
jgi:hypothetical protein